LWQLVHPFSAHEKWCATMLDVHRFWCTCANVLEEILPKFWHQLCIFISERRCHRKSSLWSDYLSAWSVYALPWSDYVHVWSAYLKKKRSALVYFEKN